MNAAISTAVFTRPGSTDRLRAGTHGAFSARLTADSPHHWAGSIAARFEELLKLPRGWDGYNGGPLNFATAQFAVSLLNAVCAGDTPEPQIVPGPDGDLQIEWHFEMSDIELHVRGPYDVQAWRSTEAMAQHGEELSLQGDFSTVALWLRELSDAYVAARPAAA